MFVSDPAWFQIQDFVRGETPAGFIFYVTVEASVKMPLCAELGHREDAGKDAANLDEP